MDCTKNPKRCAEILEEASDDAADSSSGSSDGAAQSLGSGVASEILEYRQKQLKIKNGTWSKQNGKWIAATNSKEWTTQIIKSWKNKK